MCLSVKEEALVLVVSPLLLSAAALGDYGFIGECFLFPSSPSGMDPISRTDQTRALISYLISFLCVSAGQAKRVKSWLKIQI